MPRRDVLQLKHNEVVRRVEREQSGVGAFIVRVSDGKNVTLSETVIEDFIESKKEFWRQVGAQYVGMRDADFSVDPT